jgi:hypothetical protein
MGGQVRRGILCVFAIVVLSAGAYILWLEFKCMLGFAEGDCYVIGWAVIGGAAMVTLGGYLLWDDLVAPRLKRSE